MPSMKGSFECEGVGLFEDKKFDVRKSLLATSLKDLVKMFGIEIILIWNAVLMKKRVVVFGDKLSVLLRVMRGIPLLVWHRQNWNILRPYVTLSTEEIDGDLQTAGVYCAGFVDPNVKSREDLFDLLVDINSLTITVPEHSKSEFSLGSFHKEIATYLVESSDNPDISDQEVIKELAGRTKDLLNKLESLKVKDSDGNSYITFEALQQRKLGRLDRFLFNVASAEGMTKNQ